MDIHCWTFVIFWRKVRKNFQFQIGPQCKKGCRPMISVKKTKPWGTQQKAITEWSPMLSTTVSCFWSDLFYITLSRAVVQCPFHNLLKGLVWSTSFIISKNISQTAVSLSCLRIQICTKKRAIADCLRLNQDFATTNEMFHLPQEKHTGSDNDFTQMRVIV